MFQRLLVCTDFCDGLHRLTRFVSSLAAAGVKQITFLHSVPFLEDRNIPREDTESINRARQRLESALQNAPTELDIQVRVCSGRAIDAILKSAKDYQSDLIILGTPTRSLLTEKLFGSTLIQICQRTLTPIMSLRPQLIATFTSEELDLRCRHLFRHLLIPYDGSNAAKYLVSQIKPLVQSQTVTSLERLHLCWVVDGIHRREIPNDYRVEEARKALAAVKADLESPYVQIGPIEVRQGDPITEVLDAAQMSDVSAIAVSSDSMGKLIEWSAPSFNSELLRRSWHPILYFPPNR